MNDQAAGGKWSAGAWVIEKDKRDRKDGKDGKDAGVVRGDVLVVGVS
jgi:hypothetical protein